MRASLRPAWMILPLLAAACGSGGAPGRATAFACLSGERCERLLVAAHRGMHRHLPENSLAALRAGAGVGVDLVEVDVRDTADGALVLMHDDTVDRTTDGTGAVGDLTWAPIQALALAGAVPGDPESERVPSFSEALALADQLGLMLYVDQKTDRTDLVLAAIQAGGYQHVALVRDGADKLAGMVAADPDLLVMPPVDNGLALDYVRGLLPDLRVVEIPGGGPVPQLVAVFHAEGLLVQQDVLAYGDTKALIGDYTGWAEHVAAGVDLLQTDHPDLLVPAIAEYEGTGVFAPSGPPGL